jgi:hypothetical protein
MTAKEKAMELVDLFYQLFPLDKDVITTDGELHWEYNDWQQSKKAALIAVDELLNNFLSNRTTNYGKERYYFWQAVKQEITQL